MKSPFPGMDPYIEACGLWEGFHNRLIHKIDETLARQLPAGYSIDTATRTYVVLMESEGKKEHLAKPDVTMTQSVKKPRKQKGSVAVAEPRNLVEPVSMRAVIPEQHEETFVEIYVEGEERSLVTCIEVLSPSNKRNGSEGRSQYERKRQAMLIGRANFVEIDLLRGGDKMPMISEWPVCPFTLLVSRMAGDGYCRVWPGHYRTPLPVIPIPLYRPDPDMTLELQPLIDDIYTLGRYHERIDYRKELKPPLAEEESAWVKQTLEVVPGRPASKRSRKGRGVANAEES